MTSQVVPILTSVFMDPAEVEEVREACVLVLLQARPSYVTLRLVAARLRRERSTQVCSLVYTSLVSLALQGGTRDPELRDL
jgi:hypothetical protein